MCVLCLPRYESELAIRQSVEGDIAGLKKVIDDTNLGRMNIEGEIETVREELAFLQKNHENVSDSSTVVFKPKYLAVSLGKIIWESLLLLILA